ncbi:unnamed protein product [Chilo suppressalis]|uniref:Uncharacterized protein n=1 Tax=Chilo suppressalis TaxID=168631 RepID=A0ABN8BCA7_CHISP|nr:hypothetical protein evm_000977 [Chilo suppressalis]CAH0405542.1 unnamed protein product [Chilo suppressalis]
MGSPNSNTLPIILVSAKDQDSANTVIAEVISTPDVPVSKKSESNHNHIWRLVNKYYSADVQLLALADGEALKSQQEDLIEGHIVFLTEAEASSDSVIEVMKQRMHNGKAANVRVVVTENEFEDSALVAIAATCHYELIPLHATADPDAGEAAGPERIKAAFHAHVWPGMQPFNCLPLTLGDNDDSDSDSWSSWQGADEVLDDNESNERWVERAEAFAAALGSLPQAAAAVRAERGDRAVRLARAELVLAAFCDALGEPLHLPQDRIDREL